MIVIVLIVVLVLLGLIFVAMYNKLVRLRNRIENAWAQIDVQLQRRNDLIPNLVETVKGYAAHEKGVLEGVTQARANGHRMRRVPPRKAAAENMLTGALKSLFAVSEAYPDLKANQNFLALQEELAGTEGKVAYARQFYNDERSQLQHHASSRSPPSCSPSMFSFKEREYYEAEDDARGAVNVQF